AQASELRRFGWGSGAGWAAVLGEAAGLRLRPWGWGWGRWAGRGRWLDGALTRVAAAESGHDRILSALKNVRSRPLFEGGGGPSTLCSVPPGRGPGNPVSEARPQNTIAGTTIRRGSCVDPADRDARRPDGRVHRPAIRSAAALPEGEECDDDRDRGGQTDRSGPEVLQRPP